MESLTLTLQAWAVLFVCYLFVAIPVASLSVIVGYSSTLAFFRPYLPELKVSIKNLHMDTQSPYKIQFKKNLLIVLITIILTILIEPWACQQTKRLFMTQQEILDADTPPGPADSVKIEGNQISREEFESEYGADRWFIKRKANPIAFDKTYNSQKLDVYGEIMEISDNYGCSTVLLKVDENPFHNITCSNCRNGEDKWKKDVLEVAVGIYIHINGRYDASASNSREINLESCHIVADPSGR